MKKMIAFTYQNEVAYVVISKICVIKQLANCSAIYCDSGTTFFSDLTAKEIFLMIDSLPDQQ